MIYPEINEPKDQIWVIHCTHQDCNDTPIYFNDIEYVSTYLSKHHELEGIDKVGKDKHPECKIWIFKKDKQFTDLQFLENFVWGPVKK